MKLRATSSPPKPGSFSGKSSVPALSLLSHATLRCLSDSVPCSLRTRASAVYLRRNLKWSSPSSSVPRYARAVETLTISGTVVWSILRSRDTHDPCSSRCCCYCCLNTSSTISCDNGITCAVRFVLMVISTCCIKALQNDYPCGMSNSAIA